MRDVFMRQALDLAREAQGLTSPNPAVGAVIVKDDKVVGTGFHMKAGSDHAEVVAINDVLNNFPSADESFFSDTELYVTLEPCSHVGRTAACADLVIKVGIGRVYIGMLDPNPKVNGTGLANLKGAGVAVEVLDPQSELANDVMLLNQAFIKAVSGDFPYVCLKSGISLDGKIALDSGESKWITSEDSRSSARLERSMYDAVVVGSGTVIADNPELAAHGKYADKGLFRVVIDNELSTPLDSDVYRDENCFVAHSKLAAASEVAEFEDAGIRVASFGDKKVDFAKLFSYLYSELGMQSIFVEGGAGIHSSLYSQFLGDDPRLIDKLSLYIAPKILGGSKSFVSGDLVANLGELPNLENVKVEMLASDVHYSGFFNLY